MKASKAKIRQAERRAERESYAEPVDDVGAWLAAWDERPVVWTLIGALSLLGGVIVWLVR